jgi:hypothetical protein
VAEYVDKFREYRWLWLDDGSLKGFASGKLIAASGIMVPFFNGTHYHGRVARVNIAASDFSNSKVDVLDFETIDPQLVGFKDVFALEDQSEAYLVPYKHSKMAAFDPLNFHRARDKIKVLDLAAHDPDLKGFISGFVVGNSGYLVPRYNGQAYFGKVVQINLRSFTVRRHLDMQDTDKNLAGFTNGFYYMRVSETHNYTENQLGIKICEGIGLVDLDTSIVTEANVTIDPIARGDVLELPRAKLFEGAPGDDLVRWMPDQNGITGTYYGKESRLQLTGGATRDEYEHTLRSIWYWSTSEDPPETVRTVNFNVQGQLVYKIAISVTKVNDFVTIEKLMSRIMYVQGSPDTGIASGLVIMDLELMLQQQAKALQDAANDADNDKQMALHEMMMMMMMMMMAGEIKFNLLPARIYIIENFDPRFDWLRLSLDSQYLRDNNYTSWSQAGINTTYNRTSGELLLYGEASIQIYQSALRAVMYQSNSDDESTRIIAFTINDGTTEQRVATMEISAVSRQVSISVVDVQDTSTEDGGQATFRVVLSDPPKSPILLAVTSSDSTEGVCQPTFAVVSKDNYLEGVPVKVTGQGDNLDDGDVQYTATVVPITTKDKDYLRHPPVDVSLKNLDDPINKVKVESAPSTCQTTEDGGECPFTVKAPVWHSSFERIRVNLETNNVAEGMLLASDGSMVNDLVVYLTPHNHVTGVVVTVKGKDDDLDDEDVNFMINIVATIELKSGDPRPIPNRKLLPSAILGLNVDNDKAGIVVTPCADSTTSEAGEPCAIVVTLLSQPLHPVTLRASSSLPSEGRLEQDSFTVQPAKWNVPTTFTVLGVDDVENDGPRNYEVRIVSESTDLSYNALQTLDKTMNVALQNLDNDVSSLIVKQGGTRMSGSALPCDETGQAQTFTVELANKVPFYDVIVGIASSNVQEGVVDKESITFNEFNYAQPQMVTVTGQDDAVLDGDVGFKVTLSLTSQDTFYDGVEWYFFMYNLDDEIIAFDKPACVVYESGQRCSLGLSMPAWVPDAYTSIEWKAQNLDPTIVTLSETDFKWDNATSSKMLYMNMSAVDNDVDNEDAAFTIRFSGSITYFHHGPAGGTTKDIAAAGLEFKGTSVNDDKAGMTISQRSGAKTEEAGITMQNFTVRLESEPVKTVHVPIRSSDVSEGVTCQKRTDCPDHFPDMTPLMFDASNWNVGNAGRYI